MDSIGRLCSELLSHLQHLICSWSWTHPDTREGIDLYTIAPDMPQIVGNWHAVQHTNNIFIQRQLEFDRDHYEALVQEGVQGFEPEQLSAYHAITQAYKNPTQSQQLFLIHVPGGTLKTFLYNTLTART